MSYRYYTISEHIKSFWNTEVDDVLPSYAQDGKVYTLVR